MSFLKTIATLQPTLGLQSPPSLDDIAHDAATRIKKGLNERPEDLRFGLKLLRTIHPHQTESPLGIVRILFDALHQISDTTTLQQNQEVLALLSRFMIPVFCSSITENEFKFDHNLKETMLEKLSTLGKMVKKSDYGCYHQLTALHAILKAVRDTKSPFQSDIVQSFQGILNAVSRQELGSFISGVGSLISAVGKKAFPKNMKPILQIGMLADGLFQSRQQELLNTISSIISDKKSNKSLRVAGIGILRDIVASQLPDTIRHYALAQLETEHLSSKHSVVRKEVLKALLYIHAFTPFHNTQELVSRLLIKVPEEIMSEQDRAELCDHYKGIRTQAEPVDASTHQVKAYVSVESQQTRGTVLGAAHDVKMTVAQMLERQNHLNRATRLLSQANSHYNESKSKGNTEAARKLSISYDLCIKILSIFESLSLSQHAEIGDTYKTMSLIRLRQSKLNAENKTRYLKEAMNYCQDELRQPINDLDRCKTVGRLAIISEELGEKTLSEQYAQTAYDMAKEKNHPEYAKKIQRAYTSVK